MVQVIIREFSPRKSCFEPVPDCVGYVVDAAKVGQIFLVFIFFFCQYY
jgi:hypothetical protein